METEALVKELQEPQPNLQLIKETLDQHPELINGLLSQNATILHLALRTDVIFGTSLTSFLLQTYQINPNLQNEGGSTALLWGLAACEEMHEQGNSPNWSSIKALLSDARLNLKKDLIYRGCLLDFIKSEYPSPELFSILKDLKWEKLKHLIYLKESLKSPFPAI